MRKVHETWHDSPWAYCGGGIEGWTKRRLLRVWNYRSVTLLLFVLIAGHNLRQCLSNFSKLAIHEILFIISAFRKSCSTKKLFVAAYSMYALCVCSYKQHVHIVCNLCMFVCMYNIYTLYVSRYVQHEIFALLGCYATFICSYNHIEKPVDPSSRIKLAPSILDG